MDKSVDKIQKMFDEIAPTYDLLNHILSFRNDVRWRKKIIKYLIRNNCEKNYILDLASGTGDLSKELLQLNPQKLFACDISQNMLLVQKEKIKNDKLQLVKADALNLPFKDSFFDIVTIGFGIRNFEKLSESLIEIKRVLKRNGVLIILEMFSNNDLKAKLFNLYFNNFMPLIGKLISRNKYAYNYLFQSVNDFYNVNKFIEICERCGFKLVNRKNNLLGIVNTVYLGINK